MLAVCCNDVFDKYGCITDALKGDGKGFSIANGKDSHIVCALAGLYLSLLKADLVVGCACKKKREKRIEPHVMLSSVYGIEHTISDLRVVVFEFCGLFIKDVFGLVV